MQIPYQNIAKFYDQIYAEFVPEELTEYELSIISSLTESGNEEILDIGCGTGRHAVPLAGLGHKVTAIDESRGMLDVLESKEPPENLTTQSISFLEADFKDKQFDLAIMMWNVFNELAKNRKDAMEILNKLFLLLKPDAKALIDIDVNTINIGMHESVYSRVIDGKTYRLNWKTLDFDEDKMLTTSQKHIEIFDENGEKISEGTSVLNRKWWNKKEFEDMATEAGFEVEVFDLKKPPFDTNHTYFILRK